MPAVAMSVVHLHCRIENAFVLKNKLYIVLNNEQNSHFLSIFFVENQVLSNPFIQSSGLKQLLPTEMTTQPTQKRDVTGLNKAL